MQWRSPGVWSVWLLALAGLIVIAVATPAHGFVWLPIMLGICTLAAFGTQLATPTKPGLVDRLAFAIGGAIVVLGVGTAVLAPLALVPR